MIKYIDTNDAYDQGQEAYLSEGWPGAVNPYCYDNQHELYGAWNRGYYDCLETEIDSEELE